MNADTKQSLEESQLVQNDEEERLLIAGLMQEADDDDDDEEEAAQRRREIRRQARRKRASAMEQDDEEQKQQHHQQQQPLKIHQEGTNLRRARLGTKEALELESAPRIEPTNMTTNDDKEEDIFDMFSSSTAPDDDNDNFDATSTKRARISSTKLGTTMMAADYQDEEGYYKAVMGETLDLANTQFTVLGVVGKGVFSTVLQCSTTTTSSTCSNSFPPTVAIKMIRHNDTMAKAAQSEVRFLQKLASHPHIVSLLIPDLLEHRGHVVLIFPFIRYNLRDVLQKFGKGIGLSLTAVASYFGQFLSALHHLEIHGIIHADLKPDNILVCHDFTTCQFCDFGSAMEEGSTLPTPYLVSRYYRAPEVILGDTPTPALDLWSIAVTVAELFTGSVLFAGKSNNDMIFQFMAKLGPVPNKTIRHHHVAMTKHAGIVSHFSMSQQQYQFLKSSVDPVTNRAVVHPMSLLKFPTAPLQQLLLKSKSPTDSRPLVLLFSDLLHKCLALEPTRRSSIVAAVKHDFFGAAQKSTKDRQERLDGDGGGAGGVIVN